MRFRTALAAFLLAAVTASAHAIELRISAQALERTLQRQLFNAPDGRYYIRGKQGAACFVAAQDPHVSFSGDRVVVHVKTTAKLGSSVFGNCVGLNMAPEADVSILPDAQGETIGFKDARVDHLTESRELNLFLVPFLTSRLPQKLSVNAADLLRKALSTSQQTTGYNINVDNLRIRSMQVIDNALVVDVDGAVSVQ